MSKKIIYLLSLLMALSLVFASCKKNSVTDALGGGPQTEDEIKPDENLGSDGLYDKWEDMQNKNAEPVQRSAVFKYDGNNFFRNPVIVALGQNTNAVLIVAEERYKRNGSQNDIGVDGAGAVDIVYALSTDGGKSFDTGVSVKTINSAADNYSKAKGAPVVFKLDDNNVAIVVSSGAAISRTDEYYSDRTTKSALYYTIGTLSGNDMQWTEWMLIGDKEGTDNKVALAVAKCTSSISKQFDQFGTHSARGYASTSGSSTTLLLSVVMANQGKNGDYKEAMGFLLLPGTWTSGQKQITWNVPEDPASKFVAFEKRDNNSSIYKEARIIGGNETSPQYLVVPNGGRNPLKIAYGNGFSKPTDFVGGGDGSIGSVTVPYWYGTQKYDPDTQLVNVDQANSYGSTPKAQNLLSHVATVERNLTFYLVDKNWTAIEGTGYLVNEKSDKAKSSSMDVLGDGTIVMVAEAGFVDTAVDRSYQVDFVRYTQYFLAVKTHNEAK